MVRRSSPESSATLGESSSSPGLTPARSAFGASLVLYAATIVTAVIWVPWDSAVAPWADLATDQLSAFTPEQINATDAYVDGVWLAGLVSWLAPAVLALVVLFVPQVRTALARLAPRQHPALSRFLAAAVLLAATRLATLPFALVNAQARRDHDLLVESWNTWLLRWLAESAVVVVLGALGVGLVLTLLQRWSRRGWIAIVAGAVLVTLGASAVFPFLQRLEGTAADPVLTARVLDLADSFGVDVGSVTVIETADRAPVINAHVSGWGPTRAVTFYDTVATTASAEEIDALVAHELVHVREGDVVLGTVLAALAVGATAALVASLALSARVRASLRALNPGDARLVPIVVAVVLSASVVGSIAAATVSRALEARADREAIAVTGNSEGYANLIACLAVTNKSTLAPSQWRYALRFTHPTPLQRLQAIEGLSALNDLDPCGRS